MAQRIIDRSNVGDVLQQIYTSEMNMKITLFSEGGYFLISNKGQRMPLRGTTIEEAVTHLASRLARENPSSDFASWWLANFSDERVA